MVYGVQLDDCLRSERGAETGVHHVMTVTCPDLYYRLVASKESS